MIISCKLVTTEYGAETFFQSQLVSHVLIHTLEKKDLNDLKTSTSKGWTTWDVCEGRHNKYISFALENSITLIVMCEVCPSNISNTGLIGEIVWTNSLNHSKNNSFIIQPLSLTWKNVFGLAPSHFWRNWPFSRINYKGRDDLPTCRNTWQKRVSSPLFCWG